MCTTCGCSSTDQITISKIGEEHKHEHYHPHLTAHEHVNETSHHHHHNHIHDHSHQDNHHHHHEIRPTKTIVDLEIDVLNKNNLLAERNRGYFEAKSIVTFNLVSSPGSGKTSLLEATLTHLKDTPCYVIEGDQQTDNDAQRIAKTNSPVVQINTGKACHLDSEMVSKAIKQLKPSEQSMVFIENVGNLVCPAMFDLGENKRVVIMSVTEGDDKPLKYPDMFFGSQVCVINKIDLLPYVAFNLEKAKANALKINPDLRFFELSATKLIGFEDWLEYLKVELASMD